MDYLVAVDKATVAARRQGHAYSVNSDKGDYYTWYTNTPLTVAIVLPCGCVQAYMSSDYDDMPCSAHSTR